MVETPESVDLESQRAELRALLGSPEFTRAPTLALLLSYLCEKLFAGEANQIKEYSVGVEVFKRGDSFDQNSDSIVRVEANRLRKLWRNTMQEPVHRTGCKSLSRWDNTFPGSSRAPGWELRVGQVVLPKSLRAVQRQRGPAGPGWGVGSWRSPPVVDWSSHSRCCPWGWATDGSPKSTGERQIRW